MLNVPTHQESQCNQWKTICSCTFGPVIVTDQIHNTKIYFLGYFLTESKEIWANLLQDLTRIVSHCGLAI
jgi:hypothetical protein